MYINEHAAMFHKGKNIPKLVVLLACTGSGWWRVRLPLYCDTRYIMLQVLIRIKIQIFKNVETKIKFAILNKMGKTLTVKFKNITFQTAFLNA